MIIVELNGGLGNQLFQYAAGLSLANYHGVELKINPNSFQKPDPITGTKRSLELNNFVLSPTIASNDEINSFLTQPFLRKYLEKLLPFHSRAVYKEKDVTFDQNFFKASSNVYLKGNRQSERYFKPFANEIRDALNLRKKSVQNVEEFADVIREQKSLAIHIRRGDYLTHIAFDVLGILAPEYYRSAFNEISKKTNIDHVYVFSDDIEWAKNNFYLPIDTTFLSNDITKSSLEDFYLISQCKHQIIANSTFSWWAAWLNSNPDKIVIAPKKWFNNAPYDTRDLIPESWIKI